MHQGGSALLNRANAVTGVAADTDSNGAAKAALIFAGAFLIYFLTRSPGLDEYDSVQFALDVGLGFLWSPFTLVAGTLVAACSLVVYTARLDDQDRGFWRTHWAWVLVHIAIVFCFLPADQRYYLMIVPLLLVALLRDFCYMPAPFNVGRFLLVVLLLSISVPAVIDSHTDPAPPVKIVRFLQQRYPPDQRGDVTLLLAHCQRHFKWYAPEFSIFENVSSSAVPLGASAERKGNLHRRAAARASPWLATNPCGGIFALCCDLRKTPRCPIVPR
jgi:hypothetical protein